MSTELISGKFVTPNRIDELNVSERLHSQLQHSLARDDLTNAADNAANGVAVGHFGHCAAVKVLRYAAVVAARDERENPLLNYANRTANTQPEANFITTIIHAMRTKALHNPAGECRVSVHKSVVRASDQLPARHKVDSMMMLG